MGQFSWRTADTNKALLDEGVKPQKHCTTKAFLETHIFFHFSLDISLLIIYIINRNTKQRSPSWQSQHFLIF